MQFVGHTRSAFHLSVYVSALKEEVTIIMVMLFEIQVDPTHSIESGRHGNTFHVSFVFHFALQCQ